MDKNAEKVDVIKNNVYHIIKCVFFSFKHIKQMIVFLDNLVIGLPQQIKKKI